MTILYTWEFRSSEGREAETYRDWLHDSNTFRAFETREAALADAHAALLEDPEDNDGQPTTIDAWSREMAPGHPYSDGGVWYVLSDGEEGRVVIHTIEVYHENPSQA